RRGGGVGKGDSDKGGPPPPSTHKGGGDGPGRAPLLPPLERGEREGQGRGLQKNYKYRQKENMTHPGKNTLTLDTSQGVAENPFFSFTFRATAPGPLKVEFLDTTGGRFERTADVKFS